MNPEIEHILLAVLITMWNILLLLKLDEIKEVLKQ